jgi:serine protease Do
MSPRTTSAVCLLLASSWGLSDARAEGNVLTSMTQAVQTVFQNTKGAVVKIRANDKHGRCVGTGFFIDPNGTLYTTYAVAGDSDEITVELGDRKYNASRLVADARSGIALLKVDASTPFLPIGKSQELSIASPVVTVGYPMDLPITPTLGFIGGFDLQYLNRYFTTTHIRANVSVQRGESGAPLINTQGEVVGILISGLDGGSACYALPIEAAEKIRSDYVRFGEVRHGWIGITVSRNSEAREGSTATIDALGEATPAAHSGLKKGDTLVRIGQIAVQQPEDVLNGSFYLTAGENTLVEIIRDGQHMSFQVSAMEHPLNEKTRAARPSNPSEWGESLSLNSGH